MVRKKRKSKRTTLKDKYKIKRRVAEHHRKARRACEKMGALGTKKKLSKDPGIPNLWPFKEQLLKQIEKKREQMEEAKEEAKREEAESVGEEKKRKDENEERQLPQQRTRRDGLKCPKPQRVFPETE